LIWDGEAALPRKLAGTEGGEVSGNDRVVTEIGPDSADVFPGTSYAETEYVSVVDGERPASFKFVEDVVSNRLPFLYTL
jgi:hypothetical protein